MTVRREGEGDRGGDCFDNGVGDLGHAREIACSGRFWVLSPETSDDEDSTAEEVSGKSLRYVCRSPEEDNRRDLSSRKEKREEKRRWQRWAARTLELSPSSQVSRCSDGKSDLVVRPSSEKNLRSSPEKKLPVLLP
jgi:hypothetical protein